MRQKASEQNAPGAAAIRSTLASDKASTHTPLHASLTDMDMAIRPKDRILQPVQTKAFQDTRWQHHEESGTPRQVF